MINCCVVFCEDSGVDLLDWIEDDDWLIEFIFEFELFDGDGVFDFE